MEEEEEGTAQKVSITKETPITLKTLQNVEQLKERYTDYKKGMEIFVGRKRLHLSQNIVC